MPQAELKLYETLWHPKEYLQQYYADASVSDDEQANFKFITQHLRQSGKMFRRAIDVGCGPTLHHACSFAPYAEDIHLADYLPSNLWEIEKWLKQEPDAHNWDVYLRGVLELERDMVSAADLQLRQQQLRDRITQLKPVDLRRNPPLEDNTVYDLVTSYYCAEAVTPSKAEWRTLMSHLFRLLAPGGTLYLATVRHCRSYAVMDKEFPTACIDESDLAAVLQDNGFDLAKADIQVAQIGAWSEQGFSSICMVKAERS